MLSSPPVSVRADYVNQLIIKKLDANKGKVIWENSFEGTGTYSLSSGYDVSVNQLNDIYVYGMINDTAALFKYSASGKPAWYKKENFIAVSETNRALAVDEKNNAYILGYKSKYADHYNQWMISKYTTHGKKDWSFIFDTAAADIKLPAAIIYTNGNIYATGTSEIISADRYTTIQLNKEGKLKDIHFYGKNNDQSSAVCLAADAAGIVYVGGNAGGRICIVKLGYNVYHDIIALLY